MNFNEYQALTHTTAKYQDGCDKAGVPHVMYCLLGLAEESGEVLGKFKKILRDKHWKIDNDDAISITKELGDILWYISEVATNMGLQLEEIADTNIAKLADRKKRNVIGGSGDNR